MKIPLLLLSLCAFAIETYQLSMSADIITISRYVYYPECRSTKDDAHLTSTVRVRKHLFCDSLYDSSTQPNDKDNRLTPVQSRVFPQSIDFDDTSLLLTFNTWFAMSWVDPRLTWTKDKFPNITSVSIPSSDIWTPSLSIFNARGTDDQTIHSSTDCTVSMNGTVSCVESIEPVAQCAPNYHHWPFDTQNCTIRFGSWVYSRDEAEFDLSTDETEMSEYTENREWKIMSMNATKILHKDKGSINARSLVFCTIILERHSANRKATVVVPAIVLMMMSLTVLWMDPISVQRILMAALNVISHLLGLVDVNQDIPPNGASLPSIMIFYRNSLIIAGMAFFLTILLRELKKMSISPPDWLTLTMSVVLSSRVGQFILLATLDPKASATLETSGDDNADLVQSNAFQPKVHPENRGAWHHLATLLDRLSFVAVLLTYAITLVVLIPSNKTY